MAKFKYKFKGNIKFFVPLQPGYGVNQNRRQKLMTPTLNIATLSKKSNSQLCMIKRILIVGTGGFFGTVSRFLASRYFQSLLHWIDNL